MLSVSYFIPFFFTLLYFPFDWEDTCKKRKAQVEKSGRRVGKEKKCQRMRFISFYRGCFIRIIAFPGSTFFSQKTWLTLPNTASKSFNQVLFAIELTGVSWDFGPLEFKNIVIVSRLRSVFVSSQTRIKA